MSCYFRHLKDELTQAGITITPENKKAVDKAIHELMAVEYKNCAPTWKAVKERIKKDPLARQAFEKALKQMNL
jgi:hypothetical protein